MFRLCTRRGGTCFSVGRNFVTSNELPQKTTPDPSWREPRKMPINTASRGHSSPQKTRFFTVATLFELPAQRPCAFWLPAAFVLIAGSILSAHNYLNHGTERSAGVPAIVTLSTIEESTDEDLEATAGFEQSARAVEYADPRLRRLCVSLAIVTLASVVAGFSIAHLLNRPPIGFRTVAEAEARLSIPVMGAVPVRD